MDIYTIQGIGITFGIMAVLGITHYLGFVRGQYEERRKWDALIRKGIINKPKNVTK